MDLNELLTKQSVWSGVRANPGATARYFLNFCRRFIRAGLGVDPDSGQPLDAGGVFGPCRFYYGLVESQARVSLHIHMLIWLPAMPSNSMEYELAVDAHGDESGWNEAFRAYVDSITRYFS